MLRAPIHSDWKSFICTRINSPTTILTRTVKLLVATYILNYPEGHDRRPHEPLTFQPVHGPHYALLITLAPILLTMPVE